MVNEKEGFEEFVKREMIKNIELQFDENYNSSTKRTGNKITKEILTKNLINDRKENLGRLGFYKTPDLDEKKLENLKIQKDDLFEDIRFEVSEIKTNYTDEEWTPSRELSLYVDLAYKKILEDLDIYDIEKDIRNSTLLLEEYHIDDNNLTSGDIKAICNKFSKDIKEDTNYTNYKVFSDDEILKDIIVEKEIAPSTDYKKVANKFNDDFKNLYNDWRKMVENNILYFKEGTIDCEEIKVVKSFNEYINLELRNMYSIVKQEEFEHYYGNGIEYSEMLKLEKGYNEKYQITDTKKYVENLIEDAKDFEEKSKKISQMDNDFGENDKESLIILKRKTAKIKSEVVEDFIKNNLTEYKNDESKLFLNDVTKLNKDNFNKHYDELFLDKENRNETFRNFIVFATLEKDRYNIDENLTFQVINNEEVVFSKNENEINQKAKENFENKIIELKGQEYWDSVNLQDIREWDKLKNEGLVNIVYEVKDKANNITIREYKDYHDFIDNKLVERVEIFNKNTKEEMNFHFEVVRKDLKRLLNENDMTFDRKEIENLKTSKYFNEVVNLEIKYANELKKEILPIKNSSKKKVEEEKENKPEKELNM